MAAGGIAGKPVGKPSAKGTNAVAQVASVSASGTAGDFSLAYASAPGVHGTGGAGSLVAAAQAAFVGKKGGIAAKPIGKPPKKGASGALVLPSLSATGELGEETINLDTPGVSSTGAIGPVTAAVQASASLLAVQAAGALGEPQLRVDVTIGVGSVEGDGGAGNSSIDQGVDVSGVAGFGGIGSPLASAQGDAQSDAQITLGALAAVGDATAPAAQSDAVQVILASVAGTGAVTAPTVAEAPVDVQAPAPPPIADGVLALIAQHVAQLQAAEDAPQPLDATVVLAGVEAWAQAAPIGAKAQNPAIRLVARLDAVADLGKGVAAVGSMPRPGRAGAAQLVPDDELEDVAMLVAVGWR